MNSTNKLSPLPVIIAHNLLLIAISFISSVDSFDEISQNDTSAIFSITSMKSPMPKYATASSFWNGQTLGRTALSILTTITYGGDWFPMGPICTEAMKLALDRLRIQPNWLPKYELAFELYDDRCDDPVAVNIFAKQMRTIDESRIRIPFVIAGMCDVTAQLVSADLASQYNIPSLLMVQNAPDLFYEHHRYPAMFPLGPQGDAAFPALLQFMRKLGWRRFAIFSENFDIFNNIEKHFISLIEKENMRLLYLGKFSYMSEDANEVSSVFEEMVKTDPRIIISNNDAPIATVCWAYRYGLYGPHIAIFIHYWSYWDLTAKIPTYIADWCTVDMLAKVRPSVFFFGDAIIPDITNGTAVDSTGYSYAQYTKDLAARIVGGRESPHWKYWHPTCYDQTLFAGYVVDAAESILQSRNQTLSQWTTNSENFKRNSNEIFNVFEKAVLSVSVKGFKGEYQFDRDTKLNRMGYTPMTVSQVQNADVRLVAFYKSNEKDALRLIPGGLKWRTIDGQPLRDGVRIVMIERPAVSTTEFGIFTVIAIIGILACLFHAMYMTWQHYHSRTEQRVRFDSSKLSILLGDIAIFASLLALPYNSRNIMSPSCIAVASLVVVGFSLSMAGIVIKLESVSLKESSGAVVHLGLLASVNRRAHLLLASLVWTAIQTILLAVLLHANPIVDFIAVSDQLTVSELDPSTVFRSYMRQCKMASLGVVVNGILGTMIALQTVLIMRGAFCGYQLKTRLRSRMASDVKRIRICLFCEITVLVAGGLILLMVHDDFRSFLLTVSSLVVVYSVVNIAMMNAGKVFRFIGRHYLATTQMVSSVRVKPASSTVQIVGSTGQASSLATSKP